MSSSRLHLPAAALLLGLLACSCAGPAESSPRQQASTSPSASPSASTGPEDGRGTENRPIRSNTDARVLMEPDAPLERIETVLLGQLKTLKSVHAELQVPAPDPEDRMTYSIDLQYSGFGACSGRIDDEPLHARFVYDDDTLVIRTDQEGRWRQVDPEGSGISDACDRGAWGVAYLRLVDVENPGGAPLERVGYERLLGRRTLHVRYGADPRIDLWLAADGSQLRLLRVERHADGRLQQRTDLSRWDATKVEPLPPVEEWSDTAAG